MDQVRRRAGVKSRVRARRRGFRVREGRVWRVVVRVR